jgi:hypothetical protein
MKMSHVSDGALHAYLDGESSERERAEIKRHLAGCEACRERLEQATALAHAASDLLSELEPSGVSMPPWREIEERSRARLRGPARRSWLRPGLAWAASIAIAFAIGWFSRSYWTALPGPDALATRSAPALEQRESGRVQATSEIEKEPPATGRRSEDAQSEADIGVSEPRVEETAEAARRAPRVADEVAGATPPASEPAAPLRNALRDEPVRDQERLKREPATAEPAPAIAPESAEVVERLEKENRAAALDRLQRDLAPKEGESARSLLAAKARATVAEGFLTVSREQAPRWLGVRLRTLPELELMSTEVGPGSTLESGSEARPAIRLRYRDAAGNEIVLIQQWTGEMKVLTEEPSLVIEPSGVRSYRWYDSGYHLVLQGRVSGDSLRALAERVH